MHSEERKEPYNTLNRTNIVQQQSGKWPQKRKEKKRNTLSQRSPKKVLKKIKKIKINAVTNTYTNRRSLIKVLKRTITESLTTDIPEKEDLSKVPKRSAHNTKQSY